MNKVILVMLFFYPSAVIAMVFPDRSVIFQTEHQRVLVSQKSKSLVTEIYTVSDIARVEHLLSDHLPANSERAMEIANQRINALSKDYLNALQKGYEGVLLAKNTGVKKTPAIVFTYQDRSYVIYGQRQFDRALAEFQRFLRGTSK